MAAMQSPAPAAPGGYRPVQESDLAVGKSVVYVSRAADGHQLATRVEDAVIIQENSLVHVFVFNTGILRKCPVSLFEKQQQPLARTSWTTAQWTLARWVQ